MSLLPDRLAALQHRLILQATPHQHQACTGASADPEELPCPKTQGRLMRHPLLHPESDPLAEMTHYVGLVLAQQFVRRFGVAQRLNEALALFRRHAPYHESDYVLGR